MTLPTSFIRDGFIPPATVRKTRRLMVGSDGPPDSGKSEFALSAPGPILWICLDRGIDGVLDNPRPPKARRSDFAMQVIKVPQATQLAQPGYVEYWKAFYEVYKKGLDNVEARTIILDGDSDSWELQRLAEFGRLAKVPSILYDNVNAARRAMYARAWDAGKIVIATNKIRKTYVTKFRPDGKPELNSAGNELRVWNGGFERQGFGDQDYLWGIQLRHLRRDTPNGPEWGIRITKCKADASLEGGELWGVDCNFQSLVENVYPHIPIREWGY